MASTADMKLRPLNFFLGDNGSGKSILADYLNLMKRNASSAEWRNRHFPLVDQFKEHQDWRNWVGKGDTSKEITLVKNDSFLGRRVIVKVKYKQSSMANNRVDASIKGAQVSSLIIQQGQIPLLVWGADERRVYTKNLANYLYKAIKNHGMPSEEEWCEELFPSTIAKELRLDDIANFIDEGPEYYEEETSMDHLFYLDLGHLFFRKRLSIANSPKFHGVQLLMERVLGQFKNGMIDWMTETPVLRGERKLVLDEFDADRKIYTAAYFFELELENRVIQIESGQYWGKEVFLGQESKFSPLQFCGLGQQKICSWIQEWTSVLKQLDREMQSEFFETNRMVIIQHPEINLSIESQRKLMDMIVHDILQYPYLHVVIETHSPFLVDYVSSLIAKGTLSGKHVAKFQFSQNRKGETSVQSIPQDKYIQGCHGNAQFSEENANQQYKRIIVKREEHWN